jgi:ankyrin repeat protein
MNPLQGYIAGNKHNMKYWTIGEVFQESELRSLAWYAARGDAEQIQKLKETGVDINGRGLYGITPLLWTLYSGNKVGFVKLLDLGADPYRVTDETSGAMNIIRYAAAEEEDWFYLEELLKHGLNPDYVIPVINEPLIHWICDSGNIKRLELVVQAGADLNSRDENGRTPIMFCVDLRQYEKALYLIEHGALYDDSVKNLQGYSLRGFLNSEVNVRKEGKGKEARDKILKLLNSD